MSQLPSGMYAPRSTRLTERQVIDFVRWAESQGFTRRDIGGGECHVYLERGDERYSYQIMVGGEVRVGVGADFKALPFADRFCADRAKDCSE